MSENSEMSADRKVEILKALKSESIFGLVSINPNSPDGVILYESGVRRVGNEPAIEIPHEDPYFIDESQQRNPVTGRMENVPGVLPPEKSFDELLSEFGCLAKQRDGYTYVVVDETACSKRPER